MQEYTLHTLAYICIHACSRIRVNTLAYTHVLTELPAHLHVVFVYMHVVFVYMQYSCIGLGFDVNRIVFVCHPIHVSHDVCHPIHSSHPCVA